MMLYPPVAEITEKVGSRYMLVNVVARRAREIADAEETAVVKSDKKPVSAAVDEIYSGRLTVSIKE